MRSPPAAVQSQQIQPNRDGFRENASVALHEFLEFLSGDALDLRIRAVRTVLCDQRGFDHAGAQFDCGGIELVAPGLQIEHHQKYGWTVTSPSLDLLDFIEQQGWQSIQMCEGGAYAMVGRGPSGGSAAGGMVKPPKKPTHSRKYVCPCCGTIVRATKAVNVMCGDCMETMVQQD